MNEEKLKTYRVKIQFDLVVLAKDFEAARDYGLDAIRISQEEPTSQSEEVITKLSQLPSKWDEDSRPFGEIDPYDSTVGELLINDGALKQRGYGND